MSERVPSSSSATRCRFGHMHPPTPLRAASGNPSLPDGPRPYHCPACTAAARASGRNPSYWTEYATASDASRAGHFRACRVCFPESP
jgi:hypothetical protein